MSAGIKETIEKIKIEPDSGNIIIDENVFVNCMLRHKSELNQWLYSVLHTGNINFSAANIFNQSTDLNGLIRDAVPDSKIRIPISGNNHTEENIVTYSGIRFALDEDDKQNGCLSLSCHRPNLTPGFYMFVNATTPHGTETKRFYIGARDYNYAIRTWSEGVKNLLDKKIEFSAKVLSNILSYPRNDSAVFYCGKENSELVRSSLLNIVRNVREENPAKGSFFCRKIFENLTEADQPVQNGGLKQSFGEHRCACIADALQDTFSTGLPFESMLEYRLKQYGIDKNDFSKNI